LLFFLSCCCCRFVYNFNLLFLLFSHFTPFYDGFRMPRVPWLFVLALLLLAGRFNLVPNWTKTFILLDHTPAFAPPSAPSTPASRN